MLFPERSQYRRAPFDRSIGIPDRSSTIALFLELGNGIGRYRILGKGENRQ